MPELKKKNFVTLVKDSKGDFIQEGLQQWSFAVGKRDRAQVQIQQEQVETYSQGSQWGSVDGWKITKARGILARLTQQDSC